MSTTNSPVTLKDHCSIVHDGLLYVYSPNKFLTLPLSEGGKWTEQPNGVSVTGATCVKGGIEGDNSKTALYVVGGVANDTSKDYPGLQRYSLEDKTWTTITPVVPVTQHRQYHGAAYMNASSCIVIYAGSQNGYTGPSSETFIIEMYEPYRVQAYSSNARPAVNPQMFSWTQDRALYIGGSTTNQNMYTFGPADGWEDFGLALPLPLPDSSVAKSAILTLDDGSRLLQTFNLGETPASITTYVLLNPGAQPAVFGETVGGATTTAGPAPTATGVPHARRSIFLGGYPTYNTSSGPQTTRTDYSLAQGDGGLVVFVGGDADNTVSFFNQFSNGWVQTSQLLGSQPQNPLTPTSTSGSNPSATLTPSNTSTAVPTAPGKGNSSNDLTLLGGVLGGICGLAAILLVVLLWLRSARKHRQREQRRKSEYAADKHRSAEFSFEEGMQPLSRAGQPMGRSPVPSSVIIDGPDAAITHAPKSEKVIAKRISHDGSNRLKLDPQIGSGHSFGRDLFKRDKSPLTISKPMLPDLGDYKDRPSIELGRATPAAPVVVAAAGPGPSPLRNKSQRKTDEGWAKYFNGDRVDRNAPQNRTGAVDPQAQGNGDGYWQRPTGTPSTRFPVKPSMRDSEGAALQQPAVVSANPNVRSGRPSEERTGKTGFARGTSIRRSEAASITSDASDDYEDERLDPVFASGVPSAARENAWTPVGNTWSGPAQRPLRPPSVDMGPSHQTSSSGHTSSTSGGTQSMIPNFPMPSATVRAVKPSGGHAPELSHLQHPPSAYTSSSRVKGSAPHVNEVRDYFVPGPGRDGTPLNNDMSWLNLGTPSSNANSNTNSNPR